MIIAGCGIFLIFSADQGEAQITGPYPPFGVATLTVLNTAAFLENELQKTATKITNEKKHLMTETQQPVELDGIELKKYIELVVREVKKDN
jgi:hypothetical protein